MSGYDPVVVIIHQGLPVCLSHGEALAVSESTIDELGTLVEGYTVGANNVCLEGVFETDYVVAFSVYFKTDVIVTFVEEDDLIYFIKLVVDDDVCELFARFKN